MTAPLLTLVVPTYNVLAYLPDFLGSLDAQPTVDVEVVVVDDGSTDGSGEEMDRWATQTAHQVTVLHQDNAGLSAARNAGLARARGTWVSFPDPDDVLADGYLATLTARLRTLDPRVGLAAARVLVLRPDGTISDTHPLRGKFAGGSRVVDLEAEPGCIQLQAASACYRRALVAKSGLKFDPEVRPNFEDAYFTAHYLTAAPSRAIALVADAHYVYRRRDDGSSLVQQSWSREDKYVRLPRTGYLRLLQQLAGDDGFAPVWVQNLVLYDLLFYFREDRRRHAATATVPATVCDVFHDLVRQILALVQDEVLLGFDVVSTSLSLRHALLIGYKHPDHVPTRVPVRRIDVARQLAQLRYLHGSRDPVEELLVDGVAAPPVHAKIRDHNYFGRTLAHERVAWVPATGSIGVRLDGHPVPLTFGPPDDPVLRADPARLWSELTTREVPTSAPRRTEPAPPAPPRTRPPLPVRALRRMARAVGARLSTTGTSSAADAGPSGTGAGEPTPPRTDAELRAWAREPETAQRFERAWAFMDRDTMAQDSAEHLCRWVREHHPEVNAWFVLRPESPDWARLEAEGFRLIDPATADFVALMLSTEHRISSQVDHYVVVPIDPERFGRAKGRFTFLQHGVIKDDLSRWLDSKPLSLFVTTTPDEYASVAGDHTPYLFTSKEVGMLGLPRHDRLLRLAQTRTSRPRLLLLAPTWRRDLFGADVAGNARTPRPGLTDSPFFHAWLGVMRSPELQAYAEQHGLQLAFLPHPNLDPHITEVPAHVRLLHYAGADVQQTLADTALMITDYSSLAMEQAFLGRPVVYFHHDAGAIFAGGHIGRRGSWSYEDDGFGPVATDLPGLLKAVASIPSTPDGLQVPPRYRRRMDAAFVLRDGRCCERVYEAIRALDRPAPEAAALLRPPVPPPVVAPYAHRSRSLGTGK